jgi:hypothetical protein
VNGFSIPETNLSGFRWQSEFYVSPPTPDTWVFPPASSFPVLKAGDSWIANTLCSFLLWTTSKFRGVSSPRGSIQISIAGIATLFTSEYETISICFLAMTAFTGLACVFHFDFFKANPNHFRLIANHLLQLIESP